jgi:lysylphosphatidylglycerol synthetase-like protein (DUF2156 family)
MNTHALNEDGIAYAWFMLLALLILGAVLWVVLAYAFNEISLPINERIDAGLMSTQTAGPIVFGFQILGIVPVILIVGALIWAVLAGVNKRNQGG